MMKKICIIFLLPILICGILSSCSEPVTPEEEPVLVGKVVNEDGDPVEGVGIHYIPQTINIDTTSALNKPMPSTIIQFQLPDSAVVDLVILRFGTRDTVGYLLRNHWMLAGNYQLEFNLDSLTNGVYIYVLKYNDVVSEKIMLLVKLDLSELANSKPLVKTDSNGMFTLPYNILGLGLRFTRTSGGTPEPVGYTIITDNISLFMVKDGYHNHLEEIKVDTTQTLNKTFILNKL